MKDFFVNKKSVLFLLVLLTGIFVGILCFLGINAQGSKIVINEVCSNNFSLAKDPNGNYSDYIELYNRSNREVSLEGYYLSDDASELQKYALEPVVLLPGEYYMVWLDGEDHIDEEQTGFRISASGEKVFMTGPDDFDMLEVPELSYNTVYGRLKDGADKKGRMTGTAGRSNDEAQRLPVQNLTEPVFSAESGFYEEGFALEIKAGKGEAVYYTLDGSDPTPDSLLYQAPIPITDTSMCENIYAARRDLSPTREYVPTFPVDKAVVVRAAKYDVRRNMASPIVTKVYYIGYDRKEDYRDFPIVSIVADPSGLFSEKTGIYVNGETLEQYKADGGYADGKLLDSFVDDNGETRYLYMASNAFRKGKEWEREAVMTYFDAAHQYCFTQNVGIRIAGASTRATPRKSLNIYGREIYDEQAELSYDLFQGFYYSTMKLRNGGNNNDGAVIIDSFLEGLVSDRDVSTQASVPCVLFLNGEYWGIYHIRERYREEYLSNHFGVDEENVFIIDGKIAQGGNEEAQAAYQYMNDVIVSCDLSFEDVYQMVCDIIDVQSLIDYCCINLYIGNEDVDFGQNTALWRTAEPEASPYGDCRWRWMIYDQDISADPWVTYDADWFEEHPLFQEPILQSLLQNEDFRKQFCITFMDIANKNYAYDVVHEQVMEQRDFYKNQIIKNHRRFYDADFSEDAYETYFTELDTFFQQRFSSAMENLAEVFGLKGSLERIRIRENIPEGGTVSVNTVTLDSCQEWEGNYFTDFPVVLTAEPKEGYRFAGWSGDVTDREEQIRVQIPRGGLSVEAVFEKINENDAEK